jgi:hypothetical protein
MKYIPVKDGVARVDLRFPVVIYHPDDDISIPNGNDGPFEKAKLKIPTSTGHNFIKFRWTFYCGWLQMHLYEQNIDIDNIRIEHRRYITNYTVIFDPENIGSMSLLRHPDYWTPSKYYCMSNTFLRYNIFINYTKPIWTTLWFKSPSDNLQIVDYSEHGEKALVEYFDRLQKVNCRLRPPID